MSTTPAGFLKLPMVCVCTAERLAAADALVAETLPDWPSKPAWLDPVTQTIHALHAERIGVEGIPTDMWSAVIATKRRWVGEEVVDQWLEAGRDDWEDDEEYPVVTRYSVECDRVLDGLVAILRHSTRVVAVEEARSRREDEDAGPTQGEVLDW